jgi:hypothetical protein
LTIVGIHSPEFPYEHVRSAVAAHVTEHKLDFSHLLDNDLRYWRALGNEYWPALYLVDRCGTIRSVTVGEVHLGEATGLKMAARIEDLLTESPDCPK